MRVIDLGVVVLCLLCLPHLLVQSCHGAQCTCLASQVILSHSQTQVLCVCVCVYVCVCAYMHTYVHVFVHVYLSMCKHAYVLVTCINRFVCLCNQDTGGGGGGTAVRVQGVCPAGVYDQLV